MAIKEDLKIKNISKNLDKIGVKRKFFEELPKELREAAFYVSDINRVSTIKSILRSLQAAVDDGLTFDTWKGSLSKEVLGTLSKARLETVYRTNVQSSFNKGARQRALELKDTFPFLIYDAIDDAVTRPNHAALDGIIRRSDDDFWSTHTPPIGFNCRCTVRALTENQARKTRISQNKPGLSTSSRELKSVKKKGGVPDKGFGSNIDSLSKNSRKLLLKQAESLPPKIKKEFIKKIDNSKSRASRWYVSNRSNFDVK